MSRKLADAIPTMLVVLGGRDCPDQVARIGVAFNRAILASNPRTAPNRNVGDNRLAPVGEACRCESG
jgi:hypothetical protein